MLPLRVAIRLCVQGKKVKNVQGKNYTEKIMSGNDLSDEICSAENWTVHFSS